MFCKKALVILMILIVLSVLMSACQKNQSSGSESKETSVITETANKDNLSKWKTAYLDFLEKEKDSYFSYALVYIDDDSIPELYLSGIGEATGDSICSYKNDSVVEQKLHRIGGGWYIEKSGIVANFNGHMGMAYTNVYMLVDDGFVQKFEAVSIERVEHLENDEYKLHYEYLIGDNPANESEYKTATAAAFDFEKAKRLNENEVKYDAIRQQINDF